MIDWNSISGIRSAKPSFVSLPSFPENIIFQTWFLIYVPLLYPLTPPRFFFQEREFFLWVMKAVLLTGSGVSFQSHFSAASFTP